MKPFLHAELNLSQYKTLESFTTYLTQILDAYIYTNENESFNRVLKLYFINKSTFLVIKIIYPNKTTYSFEQVYKNLIIQQDIYNDINSINIYLVDITENSF
jgi:hypothetical protein